MFSEPNFRSRFHEFILKHGLVRHGDRLLVAVSGGVDSTVLLDLLVRERKRLNLLLFVAHVNHGLRGAESDGDEEFVRSLAASTECALVTCRENVGLLAEAEKSGIQETARRLRYSFFEKATLQHGCNAVATGHNADDNAETVLLNLLRGTGIAGLGGIPTARSQRSIIRPILFAQRSEIESYAEARQISFRTDSSNLKDDYRRNFLRHRIIPMIREEINPNITGTLRKTAEIMQGLHQYLSDESRRLFPEFLENDSAGTTNVPIDRLTGLHPILRSSAIANLTSRLTGHQPGFEQIAAIEDLLNEEVGSVIQVNHTWMVFRERGVLAFRKAEDNLPINVMVEPNREYRTGAFTFTSMEGDRSELMLDSTGEVELVNADRIQGKGLRLRTWQAGDSFVPLGMEQFKKVSDFFVDSKTPVFEKEHHPVLETEDGEIIWLCGKRIDNRFRVTETTRRVLRLEFRRTTTRANGQTSAH